MTKLDKTKRSEELNRIIRTAALTISPNASIEALAVHAQVSPVSIRKSIELGRFTVGLASALELSMGRELIKREDLCPKLKKTTDN